MSTETLTDWLLRQVADDEKLAKAATKGPWARTIDKHNGPDDTVDIGVWSDRAGYYPVESMVVGNHNALSDAGHIARHDPARVLAECEAKRRIVALHVPTMENTYRHPVCESCLTTREHYSDDWGPDRYPCDTLKTLALPFADRPGYLAEWAPR